MEVEREPFVVIDLIDKIDSGNAMETEQAVLAKLPDDKNATVVFDTKKLSYISSAGLRMILRVKKQFPSLKIINVNSDVYEILEMTGFTEMMPVEKAYREVSIEGCEEIGRGANGTIYRIDQDNVVKVYKNADALSDIQHEREVAKLALIRGIPTAISYDVVRVGESFGSVFELLNARSFSKILAKEPEKLDWCVQEYIKMLNMRETAISWAQFVLDYLPPEAGKKLVALVAAIPRNDHMIHGDYHTKNLQLQGDEVLIIDMDTLAVGHPIFELGSMFNSFIGFSELDHTVIQKFQGFDFETGKKFWKKALAAYLGTTDEKLISSVENKARILGYTRLIRRSIRRGGLENENDKKEIALWKKELLELLEITDDLTFLPSELEVEANTQELQRVQNFVEEHLNTTECSEKAKNQIAIAVEEIFINIASYAYAPSKGNVAVRVNVSDEPTITITFIDHGTPYNPLIKEDPDITLSADERKIGGLGIFMTKKMMDEVSYEYKNRQNILTLTKKL